ncbi:MAG TPA: transposase, partial [Terriglobales bacterium]|nr:transposase [Terriglobales bacterium]
MRLYDVPRQFATEDQCHEHLVNLRWPHGVRCIKCKSDWVGHYKSHGKTGKPRHIFQCLDCQYQFTATTGAL